MSLGNWDEARRLLPFAQKGTLNAALTQKYGKGEREHLKKKAWTPTDDEQPSSRGAKDLTKKKGTEATVVPESVSLPPLPPVLQMDKPTEDQCKYANLTSLTSCNLSFSFHVGAAEGINNVNQSLHDSQSNTDSSATFQGITSWLFCIPNSYCLSIGNAATCSSTIGTPNPYQSNSYIHQASFPRKA